MLDVNTPAFIILEEAVEVLSNDGAGTATVDADLTDDVDATIIDAFRIC